MIVTSPLSLVFLAMTRATAGARRGDLSAIRLLEDMHEQPLLPTRFRRAAMHNLASAICGEDAPPPGPTFGPEAA